MSYPTAIWSEDRSENSSPRGFSAAEHSRGCNSAGDEHDAARFAPQLLEKLELLRRKMLDFEDRCLARLSEVREDQRPSARNLLHYVALRREDIRVLQTELTRHGISSLGRCEAHVLANVNAVLGLLRLLTGSSGDEAPECLPPMDYVAGRAFLEQRAVALFGARPNRRAAFIMVTMPSTAAEDYQLVRNLLQSGMSCMRINCAHDDASAWAAMIQHLRRAENELGISCKVYMDLCGPKLRTGPSAKGPHVLKCRPYRDSFGRVSAPARIWLTSSAGVAEPPFPGDVCIPIDGGLVAAAAPGDRVKLCDASGRWREMQVTSTEPRGVWAESGQSIFFAPGVELQISATEGREAATGRVGSIPARQQAIVLYKGDRLVLTDDGQPGQVSRHDSQGRLLEYARISCTCPEAIASVRPGERILFDDGKIGAIVREARGRYLVCEIIGARSQGEKLLGDKGVNLPDSDLKLDALTAKDLDDLSFIVKRADIVGYSFVRRDEDVFRLQAELRQRSRADMPIVLKIENQQAFDHLPSLLLAAMRSPAAGVMIARGDLAAECGYQRLAEVQEEILWMCEAAHMPVIWATQVLESLAKEGTPSRAEITDAAMSVRAECVMLNKGPHIVEAVQTLDQILLRMQDHQVKKRAMLRRLRLADDLA